MRDFNAGLSYSRAAVFDGRGDKADLTPDAHAALESEARREAARQGRKLLTCGLCGAALRARRLCPECGEFR